MKLWIPGPTEVRAELLAECARPMIGHRSDAMVKLHERIDPHLRSAFGELRAFVLAESDPAREGGLVHSMNLAADLLDIPRLR